MKMFLQIEGILMLLVLTSALSAQEVDEIRMVKYTPEFKFRDGIFINFDMVKANSPLPPARIETDLDKYDMEFFETITADKEIVIYDDNGVKFVMKSEDIWGYGYNGLLYINVGKVFHKMNFEGSISRFVAAATTYYSVNRVSQIFTVKRRQYLFDFESCNVMEFTPGAVELLLERDSELLKEYHALSRRKRIRMKYAFIRKYNEKHPLYFPAG